MSERVGMGDRGGMGTGNRGGMDMGSRMMNGRGDGGGHSRDMMRSNSDLMGSRDMMSREMMGGRDIMAGNQGMNRDMIGSNPNMMGGRDMMMGGSRDIMRSQSDIM